MEQRAQEVTNILATRDWLRTLHAQSQSAYQRFREADRRGDWDAMRNTANERTAINHEIIGLLTSMQTRVRANRL